MASEPTHIRLQWLTSIGTSDPVTVPVRSVSERAAFAMIATSHGAGTRGMYALIDGNGNVVREGSCRILFQKRGAGIGVELLARPPLRRSSAAPPMLKGREISAATLPASPERPSGPAADLESLTPKVPPAPAAPAEARTLPQSPLASSSDEPSDSDDLRDSAPEHILGSRPPRPRSITQSGIGAPLKEPSSSAPPHRSSKPQALRKASDERDPETPRAIARSKDSRRPAARVSPKPAQPARSGQRDISEFSTEAGLIAESKTPDLSAHGNAAQGRTQSSDTAKTNVWRSPTATQPEDEGPEVDETKETLKRVPPTGDAQLPPWSELPELPKWEPPPPSPPPPRYDGGSWEPPTYEPLLASAPPGERSASGQPVTEEPAEEPAKASGDSPMEKPQTEPGPSKQAPTEPEPSKQAPTEPEPPKQAPTEPEPQPAKIPSIPAPPPEGQHPSEAPPPAEAAPSPAHHSGRMARVATRIEGHGAEGLAIGIDLGTSNTCASAVIDGIPQVIPTRFGTNTVPSVLTVIDSRVVVGHAAAKRMIMNPHETIYGSKRLVGRAYTDELADEYQPSFAYPLVETDDHRFGASIKGRIISFEQVAEYLLAEVRDVAEQHLGERVDRATITVPAYFGDAQREAVRRAARGAQLAIDRIVAEPTAAAVAYGYNAEDNHLLVVFDLGGGTFDVSVLRVGGNRFEVLATGGDAFLGGIDIDDMIAGYLLEEFHRAERTTIEPSAQQIARLREAAEDAKRGLSMQHRVAIRLPHFARIADQPRELRATLDREKLDELATGFVERLIRITSATLADCNVAPHDVDDILLVGGMTRMAIIPDKVEEFFGRRPSRRINPDEAVALGAARLAESGGGVELLDVLPLSIGVAGDGRRFNRLISRNTQVPIEKAFTVRTLVEDQETYRLPLFQGERQDAAENEYLGTLMIEEIPPGPAGSELELLLHLDAQCFLEVRAAHLASSNGLAVYINREEGAEKAIAALDNYTGKKEAKEEKATGLGRFFRKLRSFFRK